MAGCSYSFHVRPDQLVGVQNIVKKYDLRFVGNPAAYLAISDLMTIPVTVEGDGQDYSLGTMEIHFFLESANDDEPPEKSRPRFNCRQLLKNLMQNLFLKSRHES